MDAEVLTLALLEIASKDDLSEEEKEQAKEMLLEEMNEGKAGKAPAVKPSPFSGKKSLQISYKEGFTGTRRDKLNRERCYQDGKPVSCGGSESGSSDSATKEETKPEVRTGPSKPKDRKKGAKPPSLPEKFKPPMPMKASKAPKNAEGKPTTGYTASGLTNTAFGDMVESLTSKLGMRSILPEGRRSNRNVEEEGSSIDVEYDHSGVAFEIKAVCVEASEYKAKPKKEEVEGKKKFAAMHDLKPALMIVVTDVTNGKAWAYWREGIGAYALNPNNLTDWNYAGEIEFPSPIKKEEKE